MPQNKLPNDHKAKERVLANRYQVVKKLGSGNFGVAYLCKDLRSNEEQKVLKEISVGDLQPDETVDAMHEARLLSRLNHPGIVKFYDSFIERDFFCIITEYCEGGDLDQKIIDYKKKGMHFEEKTVLDWTVQLMMALQYMHSRRVLHRDLKTRNIFLQNNMVKIGDFGISRILMGTADMASTFTGTPYYMSPEVLKHEGYNSKSDVWSVGCILYELCALEHAFSGQGLMGVMYKIVEGEPPDLPKKYSRNLLAVFKRMLTKEPDNRPSAQEVLQTPFISQHISKMKDSLTEEYKAKHQSNMNNEKAEQEAQEIANLLREKSHLGDIRKEEAEDLKLKYMSPRERMRLRKMQEADDRKKELEQRAKLQFKENSDRREAIKESMSKTIVPAWKGGSGEGMTLKSAIQVPDDRLSRTVSEDYALYGPHHRFLHSAPRGFYDDDEDAEGAATVKAKTSLVPKTSLTIGARPFSDNRPITPMRDKMVYDKVSSSLDFKDGIPDTPDLANTYYSQFNEFEESGDEEKEDEEGTVVGGQDEMMQYLDQLEGALEPKSNENTVTVADDTLSGAFGPGARDIKIKNLRSQCIKILGEEAFKKAYDYLYNTRYVQETAQETDRSEQEIMQGLRAFFKNPSDCFLVDQLLFLEEQSKFS